MSVFSPKRVILFVAATLSALPLFATHPSPRFGPRMAFDEKAGVGVMFGGRAIEDPATGLTHASDQTWLWMKSQWVQRFPDVKPPARSDHAMVYDSAHERVIMFGGRQEAQVVRQRFGLLNDTWAWKNGEWQQLNAGTAPDARFLHGLSYDRDRDRVLMFGGYHYVTEGRTVRLEERRDTWELNGDTWTRVNDNGPNVAKPLLLFDAARHQTIMLGVEVSDEAQLLETLMYRWDTGSSSWQQMTPATLPTCVNEAQLIYQASNQRPLVVGGACTGAEFLDETFEWDGTTWTKLTTSETTRVIGSAMAFDTTTGEVVRYGGNPTFQSTPDSTTYLYKNLDWRGGGVRSGSPIPRSMPLFRRDAANNTIWMWGGLSEFSYGQGIAYLDDFWRYNNGQWSRISPDPDEPLSCATPLGAIDKDRGKLVVVCDGAEVFEWDGADWKGFSDLNTAPLNRRFASLVYDETLKKIVLFGGYDQVGNYRQDTWTWNGTAWAEIKPKTKPEHRAQAVMWYDPLAKKTILYSGAGRGSIEDHAERFSDMWSFNGTEWTKMTITTTPGIRFGSQYTIDPNTGKLILFGGLRATIDEDDRVTQFYDDDMWIWDGSASSWTQIQAPAGPSPRQNAGFDYDADSGKFVLFGGFAGNFYFSDLWQWDGQNWTALPDSPVSYRRRGSRP